MIWGTHYFLETPTSALLLNHVDPFHLPICPLPPCPKRRGKWLPSGGISQVDDSEENTIQNKHLIYWFPEKNREKQTTKIYIYIHIYSTGFPYKRFIQISEVLSTSWSQKRIMTLMLPYVVFLQTLKGQGFCQTNSDTIYGDTCWREGFLSWVSWGIWTILYNEQQQIHVDKYFGLSLKAWRIHKLAMYQGSLNHIHGSSRVHQDCWSPKYREEGNSCLAKLK